MARYTIRRARLAFPQLFEPKTFPGSPDPKAYFNGSFILTPDHPQLPAIRTIIDECFQNKFNAQWQAVKRAAELQQKVCLRSGDTKPEFQGYPGNWFVSARSLERPGVFLADGGPAMPADGKPYAGCYVDAIVEFFAYATGAKGVGAKLCGVRFVADGDAFSAGGGAADASEFDDLANQGQNARDPLLS